MKKQQDTIPFETVKKAIFKLIALNPVFRLRDSRMEKNSSFGSISQDRIKTILDVMSEDSAVSGDSVKMFADTFGSFLDKYFSEYANTEIDRNKLVSRSRNITDIVKSPISLESISNIKQTLTTPGFNKSKALLSYIAATILLNKDKNNEQDKNNKKNNDKDKNKQNQNEERNQDKMSKAKRTP